MEWLTRLLDSLTFRYLTHRKLRRSSPELDPSSLSPHLDPALIDHPAAFYATTETVPPLSESLTLVQSQRGYDIYDLHFRSSITSPWPQNNTVYGRYFQNPRLTTAPTIIVLHGWLVSRYVWYSTICRKLAAAGMNSLILQLPYHMKRQPPEAGYSGEFTISSNLRQSLEAIRQSVADTRSIVSWLRANTRSQVGLWGVSFGGWVGALVTAVEPRLDFVVLMVPAVRPDDVIWNSELCRPVKERMISNGITYEQVQTMMKCVTPKYFQPRLPPENILFMEAAFDRSVRPFTIEELWESWGRPHRRRYPHSHISVIFSRRMLKDGIDFIRTISNERADGS